MAGPARVGSVAGAGNGSTDPEAIEAAVAALHRELDSGAIAVVSDGEGQARQVRELPVEADMVILRRPIAGG